MAAMGGSPHLGSLTPRSGGSWRAAPCPRSASVSRGALRASGGGRGAALGRTRGRTEGRTSTAPPPRRPGGARRAGRGRGAAERTGSNRRRRRTGSGSDPATHPAVLPAASLRNRHFLAPALPDLVISGARAPWPGTFGLISARRREPIQGGCAGRVWSGTHHRLQTISARKLRAPGPRATAGGTLGDLNSWAHRPPRCLLGPVHCPLLPGATPRPVPARQATQASVTSPRARARVPTSGRQLGLPEPGLGNPRDLESGGFTHTGHGAAP